MREKHLFILCALSVIMLCVSVCPVLAKAPDMPKLYLERIVKKEIGKFI